MEIRAYAVERASALLQVLETRVRRAAKAPGPNNIHDLRVAIRRFSQSLRVFAPLLPARRVKRIRRRLRRVMTLAGEVRSRDIAMKLWKRAGEPADAACAVKLGRGRKQASEKLQKRLRRLRDQNPAGKWRKVWTRSHPGPATLEPDLAALLADYIQTAADLVDDGRLSAKALHKFRLGTKRVRYTLELFRQCCGHGLEQRLQVLRRLQQYLGEINDYATTSGLAGGKEAAGFRQFLETRAAARTGDLVRYVRRQLLALERRRYWLAYFRKVSRELASN